MCVAGGWCDLPWRPDVALHARKYYRRLSSRAYYHGRSAYNSAVCAKAFSLDRTPGHSSAKSTAEHSGILKAIYWNSGLPCFRKAIGRKGGGLCRLLAHANVEGT